jgi:RNA polymerase sigma factor (sigma-70 family)
MKEEFDKEKLDKLLKAERTQENITELLILNDRLLRKYLQKNYLEHDEEAYSYGQQALYKAIMTFEVGGNVAFSTYAYRCIFNLVGSYIRHINSNKEKTPVVSFDQPTSADSDITIGTTLSSDIDVENDVVSDMNIKPIWQAFWAEYNSVQNPLSKQVLEKWYDSDFKMSNKELAASVGCSQSYVNRILNQFRIKMKRRLFV